jgi:hypothetical protein
MTISNLPHHSLKEQKAVLVQMSRARLCAGFIPSCARHAPATPRARAHFDAGLPQIRAFSAAQSPSARPTAASSFTSHLLHQHHSPGNVVSASFSTSSLAASGHNRWSKIRHRKGAADAARSAVFSRLTQVRLWLDVIFRLWLHTLVA